MQQIQISASTLDPPPVSGISVAISAPSLMFSTRPAGRATQAVIVLALVNAAIMLLRFTEQCLLARALGAGPRLDAYFLGQVVVLLGAQAAVAVTTAAVPILTEFGAIEQNMLVRRLLFASLPWLLLAAAAAALLSGPIVRALAGSSDSANRLLARAIFLWLLPATAACILAALLRAYWFAQRRFVVPGTAQLFMPLCTCAGAAMVAIAGWDLRLAAAVANVGALALVIALYRPFTYALPTPAGVDTARLHRAAGRFGKTLVPVAVGLALLPAMIALCRFLASALGPGNVTAVSLAASLASIPGQFAAASVGMVLLPQTAWCKAAGRMHDAARSAERALCSTAFVAIPCALVLGFWPREIVHIVFQRGAFDRAAVGLTASALGGFSFGVPMLAGMQVLVFALFAVLGTRQVAFLTVLTLFVNLLLNRLLLGFGVIGIAAAFSLACWMNGAVLLWLLARCLPELRSGSILLRHLRILAISAVAAAVAKICAGYLPGSSVGNEASFVISLAVFAAIYLAANLLTASPETEQLLDTLRLRLSRRTAVEALTPAD
jgi:putative peptidoglycan lipid II flippase